MSNQEKAYRFIKEQIITGHFKPGHLLSENQMCIKLNMSRTPIREAIKQLESEGLLTKQGQKTSVSQVTLAELKDNFDLRSLLESYALEKNFPNLDQKLANEYGQKFQTILTRQDWQAYLKLDELFHVFLTENTGNPTIQKTLDLLRTQTNRMRYAIIDNDRCMKSSVKEIMNIIAAIDKKDILAASNALKTHIRNVYDWEVQFLQK